MTARREHRPSHCPRGLAAGLVIDYARGRLNAPAAWSVEVHLPACDQCREILALNVDVERLRRNQAALSAAISMSRPGPVEAALVRCGLPAHLARLIAFTPSLRLPWIAGISVVLFAVLSMVSLVPPMPSFGFAMLSSNTAAGAGLISILLLAPIVPLAGVALVFSPRLDKTQSIAVAAPFSKARLLLIRTLAVGGATVVPTAVATAALPGPRWLPVTLLLPSIALCACALAIATTIEPVAAVIGTGIAWATTIVVVALLTQTPMAAVGWAGQFIAIAVLVASAAILVLRRDRLEYLPYAGRTI